MDKIKVSACIITYNHEKYIKECIEGALSQIVSYEYEVIIGEDKSLDNTVRICSEYAEKYPKLIRLIARERNLGMIGNWIETMNACTGKYIALCEGDDYWTDPYKLQKQVDFLEANPAFSLSFHNALMKWEDNTIPDRLFCPLNQKTISSVEDVINSWFIPSASIVFRRETILPLPEWFVNVYNGDWALQLLAASKGRLGYINETMSVYRKNEGALSGNVGKNVEFVNNKKIEVLNNINRYTNNLYEEIINNRITTLRKDIIDYKLYNRSNLLYWFCNPSKSAYRLKKIIFR